VFLNVPLFTTLPVKSVASPTVSIFRVAAFVTFPLTVVKPPVNVALPLFVSPAPPVRDRAESRDLPRIIQREAVVVEGAAA
jgi:hypothetical protein